MIDSVSAASPHVNTSPPGPSFRSRVHTIGCRVIQSLGNFLYYALIVPFAVHSVYKYFSRPPSNEPSNEPFEDRLAKAVQVGKNRKARALCIPALSLQAPDRLTGYFNSLSVSLIERGVPPDKAARFVSSLAKSRGLKDYEVQYRMKGRVYAAISECIDQARLPREHGWRVAYLISYRTHFASLIGMPSFLKAVLEEYCPFFKDPETVRRIELAIRKLAQELTRLGREGGSAVDIEGLVGVSCADYVSQYEPLGMPLQEKEQFQIKSMGLSLFLQKCLDFCDSIAKARGLDPSTSDEELEFAASISSNEAPSVEKIQEQVAGYRAYAQEIRILRKEFSSREIWKAIKGNIRGAGARLSFEEIREAIQAKGHPLSSSFVSGPLSKSPHHPQVPGESASQVNENEAFFSPYA